MEEKNNLYKQSHVLKCIFVNVTGKRNDRLERKKYEVMTRWLYKSKSGWYKKEFRIKSINKNQINYSMLFIEENWSNNSRQSTLRKEKQKEKSSPLDIKNQNLHY